MTTPRRLSLAALALSAGLLGLTACGGGGGSTATDQPSDAGTSTTPTTSSPTSSDSASTGTSSSADAFVDAYSQAIDKATTAHVTLSGTGATGSLSGEGDEDLSANPIKAKLTVSTAGQDTTIIIADGKGYIDAGNGKYLALDLNKALGGSTNLFDPAATLPVLRGSITEATDRGEVSVDGGSYHEWDVTIDGKALAQLFGSSKVPASKLPSAITEKVYFDSDGLLHKLDVDSGSVAGQEFSVSTTYTDWGKPVSIQAPDPSQITSFGN